MNARLILKRGRAKPLWHGHPWVYAQAIATREGDPAPGDVVDVIDHDGRFVGRAHANLSSAIAARILTRSAEQPIDDAWLRHRLERAIALRLSLGLPSPETDAYRLVNSEGDLLPGLIVDRYADLLAVQLTTVGMQRLSPQIFEQLSRLVEPRAIIEVEPGALARREGVSSAPRVAVGDDAHRQVRCREHGISYEVEPLRGQKTGLYLDQRDNRAAVRRLAAGARVLDVYSYAGGFALNAAAGGAREVTAVDSSPRATATIRDNTAANGLAVEVAELDGFRFLADAGPEQYDLVVIDPPKFARSRKELPAALKGYRKLHRAALRVLKAGGLLASACCSQLVETEGWVRTIAAAGNDLSRPLQLLTLGGAPGDHPTLPGFTEGDYLRFAICRAVD